MEESKDNLSTPYESGTDRVFTPLHELRADAAMADGSAMADVVAIPEDPDGDGGAIVDGTAMDGLEEV